MNAGTRTAAALTLAGLLGISAAGQAPRAAASIEGVWNFSTLTPLERPQQFAGRPLISDAEAAAWARDAIARDNRDRRDGGAALDVSRAANDFWFDRGSELASRNGGRMTSLIIDPPDGRLPPLTESARARAAAIASDARLRPADGPESLSLQDRCLSFNAGPPILPALYNNLLQIFVMPGAVVIVNEMIHDARIVPLDAVQAPPASVRRWQGVPRGRMDGDTLVVDSTHFLGPSNVRGVDASLHLVERFTPVDASTLMYTFTVDDPTAFTRAWTAVLPMTRTDDRLFEYACHEGNYALPDILRGARYAEAHRQ